MAINKLLGLLINDYWENVAEESSIKSLSKPGDWYKALIHFKNYAYERNMPGAAIRYRIMADHALKILKKRKRWSDQLEIQIWDDFISHCEANNIKHNSQFDPLNPSKNRKRSLEKFVWFHTDEDNPTIAIWAYNMLQADQIEEAHKQLKSVWGIGDKIASYYLRDILWMGSDLKPDKGINKSQNLHLLQPVDIWIERAALALGCSETTKSNIAKFITQFEQRNNISPGGSNIAFWMLGSMYLEDKNEFIDILSSISGAPDKAKSNALYIAKRYMVYYAKFGKLLHDLLS